MTQEISRDRLPLLGSPIRVSATENGFRDGRNGIKVVYFGVFPFSLITNFIPPFLHTYLIHFGLFHHPL